jgi:hypothetical protein
MRITVLFTHVNYPHDFRKTPKIEAAPLYEIIVDHELEDVAEIFARLNTAGTKIRESNIVIALVAAKQQGWIRQKFDPFLRDLELKGFEFDPSVIVRTLAIVGHGSARLRDVPQSFWEPSDQFDDHWRRTKEAVSAVVRNLMEVGILSSDLLSSLNVLIPVFVLKALFPHDFNFKSRESHRVSPDLEPIELPNQRVQVRRYPHA